MYATYGDEARSLAQEEVDRHPDVGIPAGRGHVVVNDRRRYYSIEGLVASAGVMSYSRCREGLDTTDHLDIIVHVAGFADVVEEVVAELAKEHRYLQRCL